MSPRRPVPTGGHFLAWVNVERRAGELAGYYFICSCGRHGGLRSTEQAAEADHAEHAEKNAEATS